MRSILDSRGVAFSLGARIHSAKNCDAKSFVSGNPISDPLMLLFAKFENAAKSRIVTEKKRDAERFESDNRLSDAVML